MHLVEVPQKLRGRKGGNYNIFPIKTLTPTFGGGEFCGQKTLNNLSFRQFYGLSHQIAILCSF